MMLMNTKVLLTATALVMGVSAAALPAAAAKVDRDGHGGKRVTQKIVVKQVARGDIRDRTDVRQAKQAQRIEQGIRSGSLTPREVAKLREQQEHIRMLEREAERDGKITRAERARIEAAQDRASRSIYAEKHDDQLRNNKRFGWKNRLGWNKGDHKVSNRRWFNRWY